MFFSDKVVISRLAILIRKHMLLLSFGICINMLSSKSMIWTQVYPKVLQILQTCSDNLFLN